MSPDADSPLTVCYNGACPVCRGEMDHYRRIIARQSGHHAARHIGWHDLNVRPELFRRHGLDFDTAMRRLHAVDGEGRLLRGVDAFLAIWRQVPGYRTLAAIAGAPGMRQLCWVLYEGVVAPLVYRWSKRRLRRLGLDTLG